MIILYSYRKYADNPLIRIPNLMKQYLLQQNFFKITFIFAFLCFSIWVSFRHSRVSCEDLDESAQCVCYWLEVSKKSVIKEQLHWARNGMRMCPDSKFFSVLLEKLNNEAQ